MEIYDIERRLYEILGIRLFRKLALKIEILRHSKDNSRNVNYHFHGSGISSLKSFTGYLLYNAVCHGMSLSCIAVYFAITYFVGVRYYVLDIFMCFLLIVNLYCIMLQRYTYIRIQKTAKRLVSAREKKIADGIESISLRIKHKESKELWKEFLLIERIHASIQSGTDCVIDECNKDILVSISICVQDILGIDNHAKRGYDDGASFETAILRMPKQPLVISKVTKRAAKLQRVFHLEKRSNVLFGFCIITETDACENALRTLIKNTSRDSFEFIFEVLFGAYNNVLLSLRT